MDISTLSSIERGACAAALNRRYENRSTYDILFGLITEDFPGTIALVSSFGTESAVLLHLVAQVSRSTPVIFLDTEKHFEETITYRTKLVQELRLTDVRIVAPARNQLLADDPRGDLHKQNPDLCCYIRKTLPMVRSLREFSCWINGRRREHGVTRDRLQLFEVQDRWLKFNALATWSSAEITRYFEAHNLPEHPLEQFGYLSVGCLPCTEPIAERSAARSGRWAGKPKMECGIHLQLAPRDGHLLKSEGGGAPDC
jgi:phosphoadenosine phosphosulfate reductase